MRGSSTVPAAAAAAAGHRPGFISLLVMALLLLVSGATAAADPDASPLGDRASARAFLDRNAFEVEPASPDATGLIGRRPGLEARFRLDGDEVARAEITAHAPILLEEAERMRYIDWLATYAREGEDFREQVFSDLVARMGGGGSDLDRQEVLTDRVYGIQPRIDLGDPDPSWTLWVEPIPSGVSLVSADVPEQPCLTPGPDGSMELVIDYRAHVTLEPGMAPTRVWIVVLLPFLGWRGDPPELRSAGWSADPVVLRPDEASLVIEGPLLAPGRTTDLAWRIAYPTETFIRHEARLVTLPDTGPAGGGRTVEDVVQATAFGSFGRVAWLNLGCDAVSGPGGD